MKKRVVSICLLLAMLMSVVSPMTALAAETSDAPESGETVQVYAETEGKNDSGSEAGSKGEETGEPEEKPGDLPAEKQEQTISGVETTYSVVYGAENMTLEPQTSGNGTISFASDNPDVVEVDPVSGEMSFQNAGTAKITITASETETCQAAQLVVVVTVGKAKQTISGVSSSYSKVYKSKSTFTLKAKASGNGAVTYKSSDTSIATVGKTSGKVTMKKRGVCTITVTAASTQNYKAATKKIKVTLYKKPASLKASKYYKKGKYYKNLMALKLTGSNRYASFGRTGQSSI